MDLQSLYDQFPSAMGGAKPSPPDSSETIHISSLALIKMLKHGRAGVPMEVMGLMLGEFVDDYTIKVVDVFAMPQSGTAVSVEAVDPVFQTNMVEMLKQTNRSEIVVGWYHSHPGLGCWLSGVDVNTQQSFEQLNKRVRPAPPLCHIFPLWSSTSKPTLLSCSLVSLSPAVRRRGRGSDSVGQGQGRHGRLPFNPSAEHDAGSAPAPDDEQHRPPEEADHAGADAQPQPALLRA
jgi:proteasome lid subunit RPN8/RPN11